LAAIAAGIHRERATDRAGHARHPFGARALVLRDEAREVGRWNTGARREEKRPGRIDSRKRVVSEYDRAMKAAVAHEQVAAQAHEENLRGTPERAHEFAQV